MHYSIPFFILTILPTLFTLAQPHPCTEKFDELVKTENLWKCRPLPTLGAEFGWSRPSLDKGHQVVRVVFGAPMDDDQGGWLAWGINPGRQPEMVGTRAAIGIKDPSNGTLSCKTYNITYETRIGCRLRPSDLEEIKCLSFYYDKLTQYHVVSVSLNLSAAHYNVSGLNIVWQIGYDVDGDEPKKHVATLKNVDSVETLNLYTGKGSDIAHAKIRLRKVHGVLNIIGWGTLLPVGAIIARFFRKFPFESEDWWFYAHVGFQSVGFLIGAIGWTIGMCLAHISSSYNFHTHHVFAIFIFVFATLQTLAIRFRPSPEDELRRVWNIYHHFLGYALLALIYINIFEGIRILQPEHMKEWRLAVIGILGGLGLITLILEGYTWKKFIDEKNKMKKFDAMSSPSKPEEENQCGTQPSFSRRDSLMTSPALM